MNLEAIQQELGKQGLDGWLFFDHHERDPLAYRVLGFKPARHVTRRWYYFIPTAGDPVKLVHRIEAGMLDALPGVKREYSSWEEQSGGLRALLGGATRVAMQYSPRCAIPYVSMVDAGTVELVRGLGVEVATSADLIQVFEARWSPAQLESHLEAGKRVDAVLREGFVLIGARLRSGVAVTELDVKEFIRDGFRKAGLYTDHGPIVGVNANASNPHYEPTPELHAPIHAGDLVLIDLWAKLDTPGSTYYDITWTGVCGEASEEQRKVFDVVSGARDRGVERVKSAVAAGEVLRGYEVDDAVRSHIRERGYAQYFVHRTGHSIGEDVHGSGANMDNLETHDERLVAPWTCFSVEPGVYLPAFGIRSEVNVFVGHGEARVTGAIQTELVRI